jgi:polyisoprenoid-binding protein YceI
MRMDANMSAITATNTSTSAWSIDPVHTVVEFKVRHMMISNVKGQFSKVTGALTLDEAALENSRVEGPIDAASLETRDAQRDAHLRSADFFDVDKFPALSFKSAKISLIGAGELAIEGELTIRDITRKVLFDVGGPTPRRGTPGAIPGQLCQLPRRSAARTLA